MKVLFVNKSENTGGAAVACNRIRKALNKQGLNAKLMVEEKISDSKDVIDLSPNSIRKKLNFVRFVSERLYFLPYEKSKDVRFAFSPAFAGQNISNHPDFKAADIIHLHWFNQGFISLGGLKKIIASGKPIVWTLHDMWAFTGGCHYSKNCENYQKQCGNCIYLKSPSDKDLSFKIWKKKIHILKNANITFVCCSNWLKNKAKHSSLIKDFKIINIPNPIDTSIFYPKDKTALRKKLNLPENKKLLLFAAANLNDKRKGITYLMEAIKLYNAEHNPDDLEIITFGKKSPLIDKLLQNKVRQFGILNNAEIIVNLYNAADIFVLPSLEDNLPNTIMESLACGTPVLAFHTGGIPEMIDHKQNGYLADYKSVNDLKKGLDFILNHPQKDFLKQKALEKVQTEYSEQVVAEKYIKLYNEIV